MLIFHERGKGCFACTESGTSPRVRRLGEVLASYTKGLKDDQWVAGEMFTCICFYDKQDINSLVAIPNIKNRELLAFFSDGMPSDEELLDLSAYVVSQMSLGTGLFGLPALVDGDSVLEHITDEGKRQLW